MKHRGTLRQADVVIIGAGVAGLSTAYHLARASKGKRILVLEQENALGGHASGRNAGMIRQTVLDPVLAKLACLGRRQLALAAKSQRFSFSSPGSLLLARKNEIKELQKIRRNMKSLGIKTQWLTRRQAFAKVPLLRNGTFDEALFCPTDALVETKPLLKAFQRQLKKMGVDLLFHASLKKITKENGNFCLELSEKKIWSRKVVNAAGAWCALLAQNAGAQKIQLEPYRRHLYLTPPVTLGQKAWPFVWDLSHEFYFRPEGKSLLFSPCDKGKVDKDTLNKRAESTDPEIKEMLLKKLRHFSPEFEKITFQSGKSGLRTMAPDGRFVIGEDAKLRNFYWVAGLGGHGVTTCFSVGRLSSDIILGRKVDGALARALSPKRFIE